MAEILTAFSLVDRAALTANLPPTDLSVRGPRKHAMMSVTAIDRLMQLGQQRGRLEIDDVRQALPVDTMTTTELADVLARLEEAGIEVEIDAGLLTPHHGKMNLHEVKPVTGPSTRTERTKTDHDRLSTLASSIKAARTNANGPGGPVQPYAKMSGTVFVAAAALLLVLLILIVWRLA